MELRAEGIGCHYCWRLHLTLAALFRGASLPCRNSTYVCQRRTRGSRRGGVWRGRGRGDGEAHACSGALEGQYRCTFWLQPIQPLNASCAAIQHRRLCQGSQQGSWVSRRPEPPTLFPPGRPQWPPQLPAPATLASPNVLGGSETTLCTLRSCFCQPLLVCLCGDFPVHRPCYCRPMQWIGSQMVLSSLGAYADD